MTWKGKVGRRLTPQKVIGTKEVSNPPHCAKGTRRTWGTLSTSPPQPAALGVPWLAQQTAPSFSGASAFINFADQAVPEVPHLFFPLSLALVTNPKQPLGFMAWWSRNCYWNLPWMDLQ
jgi:hypothetical protein